VLLPVPTVLRVKLLRNKPSRQMKMVMMRKMTSLRRLMVYKLSELVQMECLSRGTTLMS